MKSFRYWAAVSAIGAVLFFIAALAANAQATDTAENAAQAPAVSSPVLDAQRPLIESYKSKVERLANAFDNKRDDDSALVELRVQLEDLAKKVLESGVAFRPRMMEINTRLEQLGAPPGQDAPAEPPAVAKERNDLLTEKAEINALIGEDEKISIQVNKLIDDIGNQRHELFTEALSKRYDINADLVRDAVGSFGAEMRDLGRRLSSWANFAVRFKLQAVLGATFVSLLAAAVLFIGGGRIVSRFQLPDSAEEKPTYLERISGAFWATLLPVAALALFLTMTYQLYHRFGILRPDIAAMLVPVMDFILIFYLVHRLSAHILAPRRPDWRLIAVSDRPARRLYWLVIAIAGITGLDFILSSVSDVLSSPLSVTVGKSLLASIIVGVLILFMGATKPFEDSQGNPVHWPSYIRVPIYLVGLLPIVAAVSGYIGFARFALQQIVVTSTILVTMYIGFLTARAVTDENALMNTQTGRRLQHRFGLSELAVNQIGIVSGIVINIFVLMAGLPLVLRQWGFQWADIRSWIIGYLSEIQVGSISISIFGILTGLLIFIVGYAITRWFQKWVDGTVLARSGVDAGLRNSIKTAVGYAGIVLAILVGVSAAGIELSNLALVAGALSLGIGFGLQNIVSNFVSGLLLLAERPFQAGDWIEAGTVSGFVKKVSVRATEIETFQRQTVILPNSELINSAVGNWTHRNRLARIEIGVGVAYGTDARRVKEILLEIARKHPRVMKNPEPAVLFANFGDSSLDFELRVFLYDVFEMIDIQSELRFSILDAFKEEGIEIPFPQRDLHLKTPPWREISNGEANNGAADSGPNTKSGKAAAKE